MRGRPTMEVMYAYRDSTIKSPSPNSTYLWVFQIGIALIRSPRAVLIRPLRARRPLRMQHGLSPRLFQREKRRVHKMTNVDVCEERAKVVEGHPELALLLEDDAHLLAVLEGERVPFRGAESHK